MFVHSLYRNAIYNVVQRGHLNFYFLTCRTITCSYNLAKIKKIKCVYTRKINSKFILNFYLRWLKNELFVWTVWHMILAFFNFFGLNILNVVSIFYTCAILWKSVIHGFMLESPQTLCVSIIKHTIFRTKTPKVCKVYPKF